MRALVISERAETDLREIWCYTLDTWGETQADRYLDSLDEGLKKCQVGPERGKRRDVLRPGYWSTLI